METLRSPNNIQPRRVSGNFKDWVFILTTGSLPENKKRKGHSTIKIFTSLKRIIQK